MKYQILLSDRFTGREALIECPANMLLEELSAKIKVALQLPYSDKGWHRFLCRGWVYVIDERVINEPEGLWEAGLPYDEGYRSSERIRLNRIFTTLGSTVTYLQDGRFRNDYKVRCTLVRRT